MSFENKMSKLLEEAELPEDKLSRLSFENKIMRECLSIFMNDYIKRKMTYGWHDLMANRFRKALREMMLWKSSK